MKKVTKKFKTLLINVSDDLEKIIKQKNINPLIPDTLVRQTLKTLGQITELQSKSLATHEELTALGANLGSIQSILSNSPMESIINMLHYINQEFKI